MRMRPLDRRRTSSVKSFAKKSCSLWAAIRSVAGSVTPPALSDPPEPHAASRPAIDGSKTNVVDRGVIDPASPRPILLATPWRASVAARERIAP